MKKVMMSLAVAGMVANLGAAELGSNDAEFLFGQSDVNVVAMSNMEMMQTEGQVLGLLDPVLGLVGGLTGGSLLGGSLLSPVLDLTSGLLSGNVLSPVLSLVEGLPIAGDLLGTVTGLLDLNTLVGLVPAVLSAAQPINLNVQAGSLLNVNTGASVNTSLPTLLGGLL